jgi:hypothetical protein
MNELQVNCAQPIKKERKPVIEEKCLVIPIRIKDILLNNQKYNFKVNSIYHVKLYEGNEFNLPKGWYKIQIVYKRSEVLFFVFLDINNLQEYAYFEDSLFIEDLIPEKIKFKDLGLKDDCIEDLQIESYNDPFDIKFILNSGKELIYKKGKCY